MIIAYASSNSNPLSTLEDFEIDLQGGDTLPQNVNLYGAGTDSEDGSPNFTFSWTLLKKPSTATSTLSDSALQNPVLNDVDVFGNYRLFLIITNTNTGQTSETDPVLAPNSAFVHVRVKSLELGLQKIAGGERNWDSLAHEWVDAIENHESRIDDLEVLSLDDLTDVQLSTLTQGQVLKYDGANWINDTDQGTAVTQLNDLSDVNISNLSAKHILRSVGSYFINDPNLTIAGTIAIDGDTITINNDNGANDTRIYFLRGDSESPNLAYDVSDSTFTIKRSLAGGDEVVMTQDDVPTTTVRGGALLPTGSSLNTTGKILDKERLIFSQSADQSIYVKGSQSGNINDGIYVIGSQRATPTDSNHCHVLFRNMTGEAIYVSNISVILLNAGASSSTDYSFRLNWYSTFANMNSNTTFATMNLPAFQRSGSGTAGESHWNYVTDNSNNTEQIPSGHYFGIEVLSEADSHAGHGMRVTIETYRNILA